MAAQDLTALKKFNCKACGAEAVWTPSKQTLVCPYCGTVADVELATDIQAVRESDLLKALSNLSEEDFGWQAERKTVKCQSCQAISVFDSARVAQKCDFCGSPSLLNLEDTQAPVRPGSLLPFQVADTKVREQIRAWYGSHWFAPNALGKKALTDTLHGIYLPYWTFDAYANSRWSAESGEYYYTRDSQGRSERHTRWSPVSGVAEHFFDDLLVPASRGVHADLLDKVGDFPTTSALVPYDPGYLTGWVVEQYQIDLSASARASQQRMEEVMTDICGRQVPGDTYRNLRVGTAFSGQTFKHVLLPVWLLTYTYGPKSYQVVVNGVTGKIGGEYPISWVKVALVTILALIAVAVLITLSEG
jgi:Zn finger protein HypA/HybF involved in hydrogenase expression